MEYISAEEFKKQPKEVQKVLKQHWIENVSEGYLYETEICETLECVNFIEDGNIFSITEDIFSEDDIPLLTEGWLRKFIEDNTGGKLRVIEIDGENYNVVGQHRVFINTESDLLQAYWKVALEIAKEKVKR